MSEHTKNIEEKLNKSSRELDDLIRAADLPEDDRRSALNDRGRKPRRILRWAIKLFLLIVFLLFALPPFYIPLEGVRTSGFFIRRRPETRLFTDLEFHKGIDIAAPVGTPVRPAAIGRVANVGYSDGYGNFVELSHLFGFRTVYAHLSVVETREGALIAPGFSPLGRVGQTGRATGAHLHLEIKIGERSFPPGVFLFYHSVRRYLIGF